MFVFVALKPEKSFSLNMQSRLFTFGCSITQYDWPTWADIAGSKFKTFENWGDKGAGNQFIFNSVIECDLKNKFTPNDNVVIMWSAPTRHDHFSVNKWGHTSGIFNTDNSIAHCPDGYWLTSLSFIYAIDQILKNRNISYKMVSWVDLSKIDSKFQGMFEEIISKITYIKLSMTQNKVPTLSCIDELIAKLYNALRGPDWPSLDNLKNNSYSTTPEIEQEIKQFWQHLNNDPRVKISSTTQIDNHPLPSEHLVIAQKIFPDLQFDEDTIEWVNDLDKNLKAGQIISWNKNLPDKSYYERKII